MRKVISIGLAALAGLWFLPASAEDESRPYILGGYSYVFDDSDRDSNDGEGGFVGAGIPLTKKWGLEFSTFAHNFDADAESPVGWKEIGIGVDSLYFLWRDHRFAPHFASGFGALETKLRNTGEESTEIYGEFGIGFTSYPGFMRAINLGLRADARYRVVNPDIPGAKNFGEAVTRLGLIVPLGTQPVETVQTTTTTTTTATTTDTGPKDSDGDGVTDDKDKCPGTARGITVDANGCPIAPDASGPNRTFENVNFAFDRSDLTDYAKAILDNAASVISGLVTKYPKLKVDVSAHTDWMGTDAYNQALSERRANSVKAYLQRKGVDGNRINLFSYGESKPLATNDTDEGRAVNRRAEIRTHE